MKSLVQEPLFHFLLIGAALFVIFEIFDDPAGPDSSQIVISVGLLMFGWAIKESVWWLAH